MPKPHIVILGAGPAGVGAACQLRRLNRARVTVLEQQSVVGGNAASFDINGVRVDHGSHRLHPACDPAVMEDIRALLGDDLLDRPRHGRIRLRGRWIHFPLKPLDLMLRLDPGFALGSLKDMALRPFRARPPRESFASVLEASLGPTICRDFYFPYARKIWGHEPTALSAIQARRRVSAGSFLKLFQKVLSQTPGVRKPGAGRFFYPKRGYGQISEAYAESARVGGAELCLDTRVISLTRPTANDPWVVTAEGPDGPQEIHGDYVWSTIPIPVLAHCMTGEVPANVRDSAARINYRAMLLVYIELPVDRFSEFDAHYFPGTDTVMTRMSEPKNYSAQQDPVGRTVLCAEIPCAVDEKYWGMSDEELGAVVAKDLANVGLPLPVAPISVQTHRLRQAYPIYLEGYEKPFGVLDDWVHSLPRFLTFGRQGLFAHDNTHHALAMAYGAVDCVTESGGFDQDRWAAYREAFTSHVVED